jgi:hypothetical protein
MIEGLQNLLHYTTNLSEIILFASTSAKNIASVTVRFLSSSSSTYFCGSPCTESSRCSALLLPQWTPRQKVSPMPTVVARPNL